MKGSNYNESDDPAILGTAIFGTALCVQIALSVILGLPLWHMDVVSNTFQSTPAPVIEGKWLCCFPEYLVWLKEKYPGLWKQVYKKANSSTMPAHLLAFEMFKMVQGQVDASRKRKELIEQSLIHKTHGLCLVSNHAESCIYTEVIDGLPILISRAADDHLLVSASRTVYLKILVTMKGAGWKMHDKGLVCLVSFKMSPWI